MDKEYSPVTDKSLADLNRAHDAFYAGDATPLKSVVTASKLPKGSGVVSTAMSKVPKGLKTVQQSLKGGPVKPADHIRESRQEQGEEQHDSSGFTGFTHSRHGSYHLIEGAGAHGGKWMAKEMGRGAKLERKVFSSKGAAMEHIHASREGKGETD